MADVGMGGEGMMKNILIIVVGLVLGAGLEEFFFSAKFHTQDPQAAAGEWTIAVQLPPCDNGYVSFHLPERNGDVAIIYCEQFAVKEK